MTLTTHIRFLEPIDPRAVWERAKKLVDAPINFRVEHVSVGQTRFGGAFLSDNAELHAYPDQGAAALIWLYYGPEGSPLNDSEYDDPEFSDEQRPPAAYVELCIDTPYGAAVDHRPWIAAIGDWSPVPARWWQGECCSTWHDAAYAEPVR